MRLANRSGSATSAMNEYSRPGRLCHAAKTIFSAQRHVRPGAQQSACRIRLAREKSGELQDLQPRPARFSRVRGRKVDKRKKLSALEAEAMTFCNESPSPAQSPTYIPRQIVVFHRRTDVASRMHLMEAAPSPAGAADTWSSIADGAGPPGRKDANYSSRIRARQDPARIKNEATVPPMIQSIARFQTLFSPNVSNTSMGITPSRRQASEWHLPRPAVAARRPPGRTPFHPSRAPRHRLAHALPAPDGPSASPRTAATNERTVCHSSLAPNSARLPFEPP